MNKAESEKIASYFESCGYSATDDPHSADIIILNTCVVRQSAEDRITGHLGYLKGIKKNNPYIKIILTGCFVPRSPGRIKELFPYVDFSFRPGDFNTLRNWAENNNFLSPRQSEDLLLPVEHTSPCAYISIIQGCNNFCSYCIVPYRRGREGSRDIDDINKEATALVKQGIKEITLLGQNVNSYGRDLGMKDGLRELLETLHTIPGLLRIRFLTNHPKDMSRGLIESIAGLDRICKHVNVPFQAGDNEILKRMRRNYTREQYLDLIKMLRSYIPDISLSTDVIVGFPGESEEQFRLSLDMLEQVRFDSSHIAAYSVRTGTIAARQFSDDVPAQEKKRRREIMESLQKRISGEINGLLLGRTIEVLVEGKKNNKWFGRTKSDKLVFFESNENCMGYPVNVTIKKSSPWSLQGDMAAEKPH